MVVLKKTEESRKQLAGKNKGGKGTEELEEAKEKFERLIQEAKDDCKRKDEEIQRLNKMIEGLESGNVLILAIFNHPYYVCLRSIASLPFVLKIYVTFGHNHC